MWTLSPCHLCGRWALVQLCSSAAPFSALPQGNRGTHAAGGDSAPSCPAAAPHPEALCCQTSTSVREPPPAGIFPPRSPQWLHLCPRLSCWAPPAELRWTTASPDTGQACGGPHLTEADCPALSGSGGSDMVLLTSGAELQKLAAGT